MFSGLSWRQFGKPIGCRGASQIDVADGRLFSPGLKNERCGTIGKAKLDTPYLCTFSAVAPKKGRRSNLRRKNGMRARVFDGDSGGFCATDDGWRGAFQCKQGKDIRCRAGHRPSNSIARILHKLPWSVFDRLLRNRMAPSKGSHSVAVSMCARPRSGCAPGPRGIAVDPAWS